MAKKLIKDGKVEFFPDHMVAQAQEDGWDFADAEVVKTVSGERLVDAPEVSRELQGEARIVSDLEKDEERRAMREEHESGDDKLQTFGEGAISTLVPVVGDYIAEGLADMSGEGAQSVAQRARVNPGTSTAGQITGGLVGLASGSGFTLGGSAAKAGKAAAALTKGGKVVKGAVSGAVEGAVFGGGQAIANQLLHDKEVTAEAVTGGMGGGALFGGLFGAAGGAIAKRAASKAAKAAQKSDDMVAFEQATFKQIDELKQAREAIKLEAKGLKDATTRKAWNAAASNAAKAEQSVKSFIGTKPANYTSRLSKMSPAEMQSFVRSVKRYEESTMLLANATGRPLPAVKLFANADDLAMKAGVQTGKVSDVAAIAETAGVTDVAGLVKDVTGSELAEKAVKIWAVSKVVGKGAGKTSGFLGGAGKKAMNWRRPDQALGTVLGRTTQAIGAAKDKVTGGLVKALTNKSGLRAGYVPAASTVLNRISFDADLGAKPKNSGSNQAAYQTRVSELRAAQANPAAYQQKIRERIAPLAHLSPEAGEAIIAQTQRITDYLASKLKPPSIAFTFGADEGLPTAQAEIDEFAAYVQGATDPLSLIDDIGAEALDPRAAEAMRELYPNIFSEAQMRIATMTPEEKAEVPWSKQVQLSIFFSTPMHEILRPEAVGAIQEGYAARAAEAEQSAKDFSTPATVGGGEGITTNPTGAQRLEMK